MLSGAVFANADLVRARHSRTVALALVLLIDVALVVLLGVDVVSGGEPGRSHAFAAIHLGITVAFGPSLIRRVDAWFRHRFAGAQPARTSRHRHVHDSRVR